MHWLVNRITRTQTKNITITKIKSLFKKKKKHVISHPVIAAILDILNAEKKNMPFKFSKYNSC